MSKYKKDIIRLRKEGKQQVDIAKELGCSKNTVSKYCRKEEITATGPYTCEYWGEEFGGPGGLSTHKNSCIDNPDIRNSRCKNCGEKIEFDRKFCSSTCSATYNNKKRGNRSKETKKKISNSLSGKSLSKEHKQKLSKSLRNSSREYDYSESNITEICPNCGNKFEHIVSKSRTYCSKSCYFESDKSAIDYSNCGGHRKGSGRSNGCWYEKNDGNEVWLDSSYELAFAKYLDNSNLEWKRNTEKFDYIHNEEKRKYIPDFKVGNKFFEIKRFKTDRDESKWNQFPHELKVLFKEDLEKLGCDIDGAMDELA